MIASPIIEPISIVRPGHIETDTMVFENTVEKKTATFLIYLGNVEMSKTLDTSLIVTDSSSTVLYPETTPKSKEVVEMDQPDLTRNLQQLEQIANLPNDWNQNGAPSFSDDHIKMVHDLLISLKKQPFIFPTACQSIQAVMARNKKYEMHTYTADVQLVEQNGIYFIWKNGERYIGPILPADAGILLASVHEVLAKEWVAEREAALDAAQAEA